MKKPCSKVPDALTTFNRKKS